MAESKRATVLAYTEKEIEAINILKNAPAAATAKELGVSTAVLTSIETKARKVDDGQLSVPEGVEVIHLSKEKVEREVLKKVPATLYSIARN